MRIFRKFEFERRFDIPRADPEESAGPEQPQAEQVPDEHLEAERQAIRAVARAEGYDAGLAAARQERDRSEEQTSELQSLMCISYAVLCLKKKNKKNTNVEDAKTPKKKPEDTAKENRGR